MLIDTMDWVWTYKEDLCLPVLWGHGHSCGTHELLELQRSLHSVGCHLRLRLQGFYWSRGEDASVWDRNSCRSTLYTCEPCTKALLPSYLYLLFLSSEALNSFLCKLCSRPARTSLPSRLPQQVCFLILLLSFKDPRCPLWCLTLCRGVPTAPCLT